MLHIRSHHGVLLVALALVTIAPAAGCDFVPLATATKTLSEDFKTSNDPKIVVESFNGSIDVSRGPDSEVAVDVTKTASGFDQPAAEAALDSIQVSMIQKDNTLTITARRLDRRPGNFGASVVIAVPEAAVLELKTSNGPVICEEVHGQIKAHSSNGKLEIVDGRGPLRLETSNGAIEIAATDAVVNANTSNGRIQFRGSLADGKHKFDSSNGRIELVLPDDSKFRFDGDTSNSRISCDFDIDTQRGRNRRNELRGIVGGDPDPECEIVADTNNGSIALRKAGKADRDDD